MARKLPRQRSLFGGYAPPPRDPRGRKPIAWSEEVAENVAILAAQAETQEEIAKAVGLSVKTLKRIYAEPLDRGADLIRQAVFRSQVKKAIDGNTPAARFVEAMLAKGDAAAFEKSVAPAARPARLGKKEAAQLEAQTAGLDSDWGDDLVDRASTH